MIAVPPGSSPRKISALASAMSSTERKKPRWTGATVVTMAICGLTQARQRVDLARMVHADLEHAEADAFRHVGERQRHAPMIVERLGRGVHRAARRERKLQRLLGAGLAGAAGDGNDHRVGGARARRAAEIVQRFERIADADQPLLVARREALVDDGAGRALFERGGDEGMPVAVRPADGDEALAPSRCSGCRSRSR